MNNRQVPGSNQGGDGQSPLSLLVNAADSRDNPRGQQQQQQQQQQQRDSSGNVPGHSLQDQLRLRGLGLTGGDVGGGGGGAGGGGGGGGGGPSLEEQLLLQQQSQNVFGGAPLPGDFLQQLRHQNLLNQYGAGAGGQNQQLASLLGLGGGMNSGGGNNAMGDMRNAIAAAQLRQQVQQQPQLSHADIMALSRGGGLSNLSGLLGGVGGGGLGGGGASGLASELENLQRLEELERRQRLLSATGPAGQMAAMGGGGGGGGPAPGPAGGGGGMDISAASGPIIRDERIPGGHIPRPPSTEAVGATTSKKSSKQSAPAAAAAAASGNADAEPESAPAAAAAAKGAEDNNNEELEKTPGSVIVPCRARGMPMDHNFKTAYFVIPEKVRHGEELICSYFACRNAGIKFRYCSHCKVPVAKRNFRKRHKHGGDDIRGDDSGGEDEGAAAAKKGIPSQITAKSAEAMEADGLSSQSADSNKNDLNVQQGLVRSSMRSFERKARAKGAAAAGSGEEKISAARQARWGSLLSKRPATKDGDSMSAWLMEVLAVSDLDTPLKPSEVAGTVATTTTTGAKPKKGKKAAAAAAAAAARAMNNDSDMGYGSSNDESAGNSNKKKRGGKKESKAAANKKKRSTAAAAVAKADGNDNAGDAAGSEAYVSGSFAEWKERKKQKKQAKMNPTQEAEV